MNDTLAASHPDLAEPSAAMPSRSLDHLALLAVRGPDARTFLDSQLTRNVPTEGALEASPAGYCSPKGRLLATFTMWSDAEAVWLLSSRDIADAIARRLRMYVLRAKVAIEDATATRTVRGLVDPGSLSAAVAALAPWSFEASDGRQWIRVPDSDGHRRYLRVETTTATTPHDEAVDASTWRWLDIRAGLPTVTKDTQDRFVPQMLNLEALGAVDFRKGCFPGQEVVARSQYLGKLKRRTALLSADVATSPASATDVWAAGETQASGLVVNAERGPDGRVSMLVELPLALFSSAELRLGAVDGPSLTVETLPYPLPDNEVFVRPKL